MERRAPTLLALWSILLVGVFIISSIPIDGSSEDDIRLLPGEETLIDLGRPNFEIESERIDGRLWSIIDLVNGLKPPTNGEPAVPVISYPLELEYEVLDIKLERNDPITIKLPYKLPPSPTFVKLTEENLQQDSPLEPDWSRYAGNEVFPAEPLLWKRIGWGWEDGQRYGHYSISASPFDYKPSTNTFTYYTDVSLKLTTGDPEPNMSEEQEPTRSNSRAITPPHVIDGTELLVITYDSYQDDIASYINWNKEKGTIVTMVTISQVDSQYVGSDEATSIWKYVYDTYFGDEQNLKFLLLVGEHGVVASRKVKDLDPYGPAGEPSTLHADTYFGCLDGGHTNWNYDGDANWGEVNDIRDYIPEVYVSRIAVDSDSEAKGWASKVVAYEKDAAVSGWGGTAALFGSTTHEYDDGPIHSEYLWDEYLDTVYPTPDKYYSNGATRTSTGAKPLNYNSVQAGFNSGFSIVVYMGHGFWGMWTEGLNTDSSFLYDVSRASGLQQSPKLPFISAMSCETNWFDGKESISECFTENGKGGAIAYGGATRTTEGAIGHGYLIGAPGIQEDTLRMLKQGYRAPAEVFQRAKAYYVGQWGAYFNSYQFGFNAWMEHQILGVPDIPLWTAQPKTFNVQHDHIDDYYSNFTVTVKDEQNDPVKDAKVTIYSEAMDQWSFVYTSSVGTAVVPFIISETAYGKITVVKDGFKPFQEQVILRDETDPTTTTVFGRPHPNGANGWYVSDPILSFQCSEPADIFFKWNDGPIEEYNGGIIQTPIGNNTLDYWGRDGSGNEGEKKNYHLMYDPVTPIMTVTVNPEEPDGENDWYITQPVIITELQESEGSPQRIDYWWGRSAKEVSNGTIYPPQGDNILYIQSVDEAGNKGDEMSFEFNVDSVKPFTDCSTGGVDPNENGWYVSPMTITLSSDDRRSYTFYKWGEGDDWEKYSSALTPPCGNNTLYYFSEDDHGNIEIVKEFLVPYDIMAPQLEVTSDPRSPDGNTGWHITEPRIKLDVVFEENPYNIYYYFEGEEHQEYLSPFDIPDGQWTVYCYAVDEAGNRGLIEELNFKVDTDPESTEIFSDSSPDEEGWHTDLPQITLRSSDDTQIFYSWEGYTGFERYNGGLYPPEEEGVFNLYFYSVDKAGNREIEKMLTIPTDTKAPEIQAVAPSSANKDEEIIFDLSETVDGVGVEAYFIDFGDGTDSGWVVNPKITHAYSSGGTYKVKMKARDTVGHESEEEVLTIDVKSSFDMTLLIIIGAGAMVLIILLALLTVAVINRRRHHHLAHHPVHYHPLHPLPGQHTNRPMRQGQLRQQPQKKQLGPARVPQTKSATVPKPAPKTNNAIPRPPKPPEIPQPPKPPA